MNNNRPLVTTVVIVAIALVLAFGVTWFGSDLVEQPAPESTSELELQSVSTSSPMDMELFFTSFTLVIIAVLLVIYVRLYRQIPNRITLNLILFVLVLGAYAVVANPISGSLFGISPEPGSSLSYLPDAFVGLGLAVFLYQTVT